jgi:predicted MFS family arabinose efflux permease
VEAVIVTRIDDNGQLPRVDNLYQAGQEPGRTYAAGERREHGSTLTKERGAGLLVLGFCDPTIMVTMADGLGTAFRNPKLRRIQIAWFLGQTGRWAWAGIVSVLAFDAAGPTGVGLVLLCRQVPGVFAIPLATQAAERWRRDRVMAVLVFVRSTAVLAAVAAVAGDAPIGIYCIVAVVEGMGTSAVRPLHKTLLPWLANSVPELGAANSLTAIGETVAVGVGSGIASVLLSVAGAEATVALCSALGFAAVPFLLAVHVDRSLRTTRAQEPATAAFTSGVRYLARDRVVGVLVGSSFVVAFIIGATFVFLTALAKDELGLGDSGPAFLIALTGIGGLLGGIASVRLEQRPRLVPLFVGSLAAISMVELAFGSWPRFGIVVGGVVLFGGASAVNNVIATCVFQRSVAAEKLGHVISVDSMLNMVAIGVGGITTSELVDAVGLRPALILVAVGGVAIAVLGYLAMWSLDHRRLVEPPAEDIVEHTPLFAGFPVVTRQVLARLIESQHITAGQTLIHEGEPGDSFFLISDGEFLATSASGVRRVMTPGDHFGEIALLRSVPRTASVKAVTEGTVWTLGRDEFLDVISSNDLVLAAANAVTSERMRAAPT